MRIVKYLIYLLLLLLIGGVILISTDKGSYTRTGQTTLYAPIEMVYETLRKWDNWESWHKRWTEDPTTSIHSEATTLKWASNNKMYKSGIAEITKSIPFKTIEFDATIEANTGETKSYTKINLKSLANLTTEVEWQSDIVLSFWQKLAVRFGNGDKYIDSETDLFLNSLATLENLLDEKMNEHHSEVGGIMKLPKQSYLHTASTSNKENFIASVRVKIKLLYDYVEQYGVPVDGNPEIIIHKIEHDNPNLLFTVALPTPATYKESIKNPEIVLGSFETKSALKTSLIGNYKYWEETLDLGVTYLNEQQIDYNLEHGILLKWINYNQLPANPAEWLTELYIPAFEPRL